MMAGGDMAAAASGEGAVARTADDAEMSMASGRCRKQMCDCSVWLRGVEFWSSMRRHADPTTYKGTLRPAPRPFRTSSCTPQTRCSFIVPFLFLFCFPRLCEIR